MSGKQINVTSFVMVNYSRSLPAIAMLLLEHRNEIEDITPPVYKKESRRKITPA